MATPLRQKALLRKISYFGAIFVLFTVSLIHRHLFLVPQAYRLQLREESRGEVELTSSAVRLMLTGSRGMAVTFLWYTAMDKQKRGEYHELELLVKSITKLQPYFITPWLYQSWNISFNVAVECDRPRDKYYYISRGLELLAEGERRNRGAGKDGGAGDPDRIVFPGHPELRHYMGFFYQLKIGTSDERLTMRSLIEMSCIDPLERNPADFWKQEPGKRVVDMEKFRAFTSKYPRLVRRLREQLKYESPDRIVKFLDDHKDIPNRFKPIDKSKQITVSELKSVVEQFPILPLHEKDHWPDPLNRDLSARESIDVYLLCRTWYEFAQQPLPPPQDDGRPQAQDYDKVRYRVPRHMVTQLFRQYPARAQIYIAETLESEGFFDSDGWEIQGWFGDDTPRVGDDPKYFSRLAWDKGMEMYRDFGIKNGIYLTTLQIKELNELAKEAREDLHIRPDAPPPPVVPADFREGKLAASLDAHTKLYYGAFFRRLSNFDTFFFQAEAERDPVTTAARKMLFIAEQKRKTDPPSELLLRYYEQAWPLYIHACLKFPRFAQVGSMQEDLYEIHQRYLGIGQSVYRESFKKKAVLAAKVGFFPYPIDLYEPQGDVRYHTLTADVFQPGAVESAAAQLAYWPYPAWREEIARYAVVSLKELEEQQMRSVLPMKHRLGPLDMVEYYDGPDALPLKEALFQWTVGAGLSQNMSVASAITYPGHEFFLMSRAVSFEGTRDGGPITAATSAKPIVITSNDHGMNTGMEVMISGIPRAGDHKWKITRLDANTFSLDDSNGVGGPAFAPGAFWTSNWQPLIQKDTRRITANRLGLDR
jgi:hypothetical protein